MRKIIYIRVPFGNRIEKIHYQLANQKTTQTFYTKDAHGNNLGIYEWINRDSLYLSEQLIYGSSRMGMYKTDTLIRNNTAGNTGYTPSGNFYIGRKRYELSNHLGNVMATVTDRKLNTTGGNGLGPEIKNVYDYYAFGSHEPNRTFAKQQCATVYDTTVVSTIAEDLFDGVSINGSTANSVFEWRLTGSASFNQSCSNTPGYPNLTVCAENNGGIETFLSGYTAFQDYHLMLDVFGFDYSLCELKEGQGCADQISVMVYDSAMNLTFTQTLNAGFGQGFYFTAPSAEFTIRITYTNAYNEASRCCLLIDNVLLSEAEVNTALVCKKEGYRYGFGGHEKLDEVSGSGNTVDMGDRWLDVRIGRTPKQDAKANLYPGVSPYSYALNNPLIFIDPDGRIVKYANAESEAAVKAAMKADPEFAKAVIKLDNSDVIYNYTLTGTADYNKAASLGSVNPGGFSTDGSQINIGFQLIENSVIDGKYTSLYHETEHGLQFEHGEIGFKKNSNGDWVHDASYDINDEVKAFEAGMKAPDVDKVAKENFEKKTPEQKINYVGRKSEVYGALKKQAENDKSMGNTVDRNQGKSPDGKQKTIKTNTRFFKSNKER